MEYATENKESASLRFLYGSVPGRVLLRCIYGRWQSKLAGKYLDSRLSKRLIKGFVEKHGIDLSEYEKDTFDSFNDFFTRKIKPERRPFDSAASSLCSPCDGNLSAYRIDADTVFPVKQSEYTVTELLCDEKLAAKFKDGICVVIRLCVDNYHRYAYIDSGTKEENVYIKGKLHTVRPIALQHYPVFVRNCREYTVMHTENFGDVVQIEVGALLVGKIKNNAGKGAMTRGGYYLL
ncbi:MAG: phosphatidylserine decarboxylase, partial [Clostridia bacterium]|nr:phosphatidylserine decarboxylase [Clostridia bacterium]